MAAAGATTAFCAAGAAAPGERKIALAAQEAQFYEQMDDNRVRCLLCPWTCVVPDGQRGRCRVRENRGGKYYTLVYGMPCTINNDPIEKKPFFHVYPGSKSFSLATVGCNFACKFCQNWQISQAKPEDIETRYVAPSEIAAAAKRAESRTVAYTYSEPVIFTEYLLDCARAAKEAGLGNVVVSNGFINEKPLKEWCAALTAVKIDFKAFSPRFYEDICYGQLQLKSTKKLENGEGNG